MICANCPETCKDCLSPDCCCQHTKSSLRALTSRERHEFMLGLRDRHLLPAGSPYVAPVPKAVISIRTTSNGAVSGDV